MFLSGTNHETFFRDVHRLGCLRGHGYCGGMVEINMDVGQGLHRLVRLELN